MSPPARNTGEPGLAKAAHSSAIVRAARPAISSPSAGVMCGPPKSVVFGSRSRSSADESVSSARAAMRAWKAGSAASASIPVRIAWWPCGEPPP
jgi:hypothetical protein